MADCGFYGPIILTYFT